MTRTNGRPIEVCGIHEGHKGTCVRCARAHAANEDALRDVVPRTPKRGRARTEEERVIEVRERHAKGQPIATIARELNMPSGTVSNLVHGLRCTTDPAVTRAQLKRQHNAMMPSAREQAHRRVQALPRGVRV